MIDTPDSILRDDAERLRDAQLFGGTCPPLTGIALAPRPTVNNGQRGSFLAVIGARLQREQPEMRVHFLSLHSRHKGMFCKMIAGRVAAANGAPALTTRTLFGERITDGYGQFYRPEAPV